MAKVIETNIPKDIEITIKLTIEEIGILSRAMGRSSEGYGLFSFFEKLHRQYE